MVYTQYACIEEHAKPQIGFESFPQVWSAKLEIVLCARAYLPDLLVHRKRR